MVAELCSGELRPSEGKPAVAPRAAAARGVREVDNRSREVDSLLARKGRQVHSSTALLPLTPNRVN